MWCTSWRGGASSRPAARSWRASWRAPATRNIRKRWREMNADVRPIKTAAETALAASYAERAGALPGGAAVAALREQAFRRFEENGLPHRRVEEWKYTDLRALLREARPIATPPDAAARARAAVVVAASEAIDARRIVLVDGVFIPEMSDLAALETGLAVVPMAQALAEPQVVARIGRVVPTTDVAVALNTAFMGDGVAIRIAPGTSLARPLHLVCVSAGAQPASVYLR